MYIVLRNVQALEKALERTSWVIFGCFTADFGQCTSVNQLYNNKKITTFVLFPLLLDMSHNPQPTFWACPGPRAAAWRAWRPGSCRAWACPAASGGPAAAGRWGRQPRWTTAGCVVEGSSSGGDNWICNLWFEPPNYNWKTAFLC